jgi:hypothetical protein
LQRLSILVVADHADSEIARETLMTIITRGLGGLTAAALVALGVAGLLSEVHRAPDQP